MESSRETRALKTSCHPCIGFSCDQGLYRRDSLDLISRTFDYLIGRVVVNLTLSSEMSR